jgi:hypothetical protein
LERKLGGPQSRSEYRGEEKNLLVLPGLRVLLLKSVTALSAVYCRKILCLNKTNVKCARLGSRLTSEHTNNKISVDVFLLDNGRFIK